MIKFMDRLWLYARTNTSEASVENKQFKSMSVQIYGATVSLQYEDAVHAREQAELKYFGFNKG